MCHDFVFHKYVQYNSADVFSCLVHIGVFQVSDAVQVESFHLLRTGHVVVTQDSVNRLDRRDGLYDRRADSANVH